MARATATPIERDVVIVSGADAGDYLQSQLTQDVLGIDTDQSVWSFMLEAKSEIIALLRVTRCEAERFILDVDPGWGDTVRQTIDQFLFRMDVAFEQATWPGIAYRGGSPDPAGEPIESATRWQDVEGVDVVGPDVKMLVGADVASLEELEQVRIASGWPAMGSEIEGTATPAMTGLIAETVAFDKGCYTGQEFVARVHYRGAEPPKRLVRITFDEDALVTKNRPIVVGDTEVGLVTSAARGVALGFLERGVDTPATGIVGDVDVELFAISRE